MLLLPGASLAVAPRLSADCWMSLASPKSCDLENAEALCQKAANVWKKDVWEFQALSQTFLELRFSLGNEGVGKNLTSANFLVRIFSGGAGVLT